MDIHSVPKLNEYSITEKLFPIFTSSNILLHIKFVFLFDGLYKHNKLLVKDVHLNDVVQYVLLMILMLNNNYMLNQVEHLLNKKKRNSIENEIIINKIPLFNRYFD